MARSKHFIWHYLGALFVVACLPATLADASSHSVAPRPSPTPPTAAVLPVTIISVDRAAQILRGLYPRDRITVDRGTNTIIVLGSADDVNAMRTVLSGIDIKNPTKPATDIAQVHVAKPHDVAARIQALYPDARINSGPNKTLLIRAGPQDMAQIKALISAMDTPAATPTPEAALPAEAIKITQARPQTVARAVVHEFPRVRVAVAGGSIIISGAPDDVTKAKALIAQLDVPVFGARFTQVYRLRFVDAQSVADLLHRSFRDIQITVDGELNTIAVTASTAVQQRISDAIAQIDATQTGATTTYAGAGPGPVQPGGYAPVASGIEVYQLKSAVPGQNNSPSSSVNDIAQAVTQTLQAGAPDLKIVVPANSNDLVISGSPYSVRLAKDLIARLDVPQALVVLDTEVLELDENVARNLGLQLPQPIIGSTFSEIVPTPAPGAFSPPQFLRFQPVTRTALSLVAELNLQVQQGNGKVLADPRVTTVSGRTASIRAGDTINVLTTAGGSTGTIATTQIQTFQTGVTLDITPIVNADNQVSVTLHPVVNSLEALVNGIPQIATRDTQTTVSLHDDETLVIGGLIQESDTRQTSKIPIVGDLPLVGALFRSTNHQYQRNELIIVVTPHIIQPGATPPPLGAQLPVYPTPRPLPTLLPNMKLPNVNTMFPTPAPLLTPIVAAAGAVTSPTPAGSASSLPLAQPTPTAFAQANTYVYGQAPANTYAGPGDPVKIFYASLSPTVLFNGATATLSAITTTNVNTLTLGVDGNVVQIAPVSPGKWQTTYTFSNTIVPPGQTNVNLVLTAIRGDGTSASIQIPVSVVR